MNLSFLFYVLELPVPWWVDIRWFGSVRIWVIDWNWCKKKRTWLVLYLARNIRTAQKEANLFLCRLLGVFLGYVKFIRNW